MRAGITLVVILAGLAIGFGLGAFLGWWFPLHISPTTPAALHPLWQADYILMTAQAYSLDGDLNLARQRLSALGLSDAGEAVAQRGQAAMAEGLSAEDIGRLARLAAALGTRRPELEPYLAR